MCTCNFEDCEKPSARTNGECIICDSHLRAKHLRPEHHMCPKWEDGKAYDPVARDAEQREITNLKVDTSALLSRASFLRHSCPSSPPPDLQCYIMRSKVATLLFLDKTNVPAPRIFDYNVNGGNPIGMAYILMEKLPGKSLRWSVVPPEQRKKAFPFDQMGSLNYPGTDQVGPFARESLTDYCDECYTKQEVDAFPIHHFLLDSPLEVLSYYYHDDTQFYLRHADDKGDHLLVDDDYNITGIVDSEWAYTDAKPAAFNSTLMLLPVADFHDGKSQLGEDELIFCPWPLIHRFEFCCEYSSADWNGFLDLFFGLARP
ncbi:hypothetical protein BDV29DRAFT_201197 [Aspergillus leporis]|uniref:Aminoglycoside phosphotransferase domain-containing protein n=1 Tax=Aspergillus leporis TaxID=41062 RepID=A0A5N5X3T0_9EURO|nr:hypothetical protein BDV29DRAFT_201197 [Aspergillus leporis]